MSRDIWIILFTFGVVIFGWPLLSIFGSGLAEYLFIAWFIFIILVYVAVEIRGKEEDGG